MTGALSIALLAAAAAAVRPAGPGAARRLHTAASVKPMANSNFTLTVNPATITFTTTSNPGTTPVVAGSSAATASWTAFSIFDTSNWTLTVNATAASLSNCPWIPVSAVTVTCSSAAVGGLGATGACSGAFPLSTTPQQVAGGAVGGLFSYNYTVTINFTLADSWKYIAEQSPACSLSLNYLANVP